MYAYALCALAEKWDKELIGMEDFVNEFPDGIPTEDARHTCWDAQKVDDAPLGNGYDDPENWEMD